MRQDDQKGKQLAIARNAGLGPSISLPMTFEIMSCEATKVVDSVDKIIKETLQKEDLNDGGPSANALGALYSRNEARKQWNEAAADRLGDTRNGRELEADVANSMKGVLEEILLDPREPEPFVDKSTSSGYPSGRVHFLSATETDLFREHNSDPRTLFHSTPCFCREKFEFQYTDTKSVTIELDGFPCGAIVARKMSQLNWQNDSSSSETISVASVFVDEPSSMLSPLIMNTPKLLTGPSGQVSALFILGPRMIVHGTEIVNVKGELDL
ncbi:hypothetical protein C8J56DRAFT_891127 [Mycena floridula]|nr:hypothetical protein C8J56DRAFT_891127 [Mycena floridula]